MDENTSKELKRYRAKVTGRHAITLPAELCRDLALEIGDTVELEQIGTQVTLWKSGDDFESLRGALHHIFPDWASVEVFLQEERAGWDEREAAQDEFRSQT